MIPSKLMLAALIGATFRDTQPADGAAAGGATKQEAAPPAPAGMKNEVFHFRKEKVTDESGQEIGEVFKHPSVTIPLPLVTKELVLEIFSAPSEGDGNRATEQKYILDTLYDQIYLQAREQINEAREAQKDNKEFRVTADVLDYNKLNITALANMPASERGNKISEEDIKAFIADYVAIMPAALQKEASKIKAQAGLLEKGLRTVKTDKKVLEVMGQVLQVWAGTTTALEEHQSVYEMLKGRIDKWSKAEPKNVLEQIF
jgi:hypothetical protein